MQFWIITKRNYNFKQIVIIIDFLIYHLTCWFEEHNQNLIWSTPVKRAVYTMGLATMGILFSIEQLMEFTVLRQTNFQLPKLLFILIGLGIMQLYDYIYIQRQRFEKIQFSKFNISKKNGIVVSLVVIIFFILIPFVIFMIFVPFGGHSLAPSYP